MPLNRFRTLIGLNILCFTKYAQQRVFLLVFCNISGLPIADRQYTVQYERNRSRYPFCYEIIALAIIFLWARSSFNNNIIIIIVIADSKFARVASVARYRYISFFLFLTRMRIYIYIHTYVYNTILFLLLLSSSLYRYRVVVSSLTRVRLANRIVCTERFLQDVAMQYTRAVCYQPVPEAE